MLIESYDVEVFTPPCEPGAERYAARARLKVDISEVLPLSQRDAARRSLPPGGKCPDVEEGRPQHRVSRL
jgi:hypothetical protein